MPKTIEQLILSWKRADKTYKAAATTYHLSPHYPPNYTALYSALEAKNKLRQRLLAQNIDPDRDERCK